MSATNCSKKRGVLPITRRGQWGKATHDVHWFTTSKISMRWDKLCINNQIQIIHTACTKLYESSKLTIYLALQQLANQQYGQKQCRERTKHHKTYETQDKRLAVQPREHCEFWWSIMDVIHTFSQFLQEPVRDEMASLLRRISRSLLDIACCSRCPSPFHFFIVKSFCNSFLTRALKQHATT